MKIAVYAIAKNEVQFVERWASSAVEADDIYLLDTGSDDGTADLAESLGVITAVQRFDPWRFDVARNVSLSMVASDVDVCIALDLDEVLVPGWREHLEATVATRPRYRYTWSWVDGKPGLVYGGDKIHARHGYVWRHPVHEVITPIEGFVESQEWCGLEIHHHPDAGKSRGQYLPLLELAVREDPDDDRNAHYLAREYFFAGRMEEAQAEFQRHLDLPTAVWGPERAQSCRYLYKITGDVAWLRAAIREAPDRREPWVEMAQAAYDSSDWADCLQSAVAALRIKERPLEYLTEDFAWGALPHDLAAIAAYRLGYVHEARFHGLEAIRLAPYDDRLVANYRWYREAVA